ncbi:hypothetical protein M0802_014808 [Mischocyttarus mexicanus]|nr:hypothetical protein M0802_014808 [Mischocyttarus mexicanus]
MAGKIVDETGLLYRLMPDRTLKFTGENCSGGNTLLTSEEPTEENIVEYITANKQCDSDEEEKIEEESLPTAEEALKAAYSF